MDFALLSALVGSLSLGLMILFDRLMMGDCYRNHPDHAWFVSSLAGASFGLIATLLTWVGFTIFADISFSELFQLTIDLALPYGLLMFFVGVVNIQVMRHYFRLFIPDKNEQVNETAIAMWLAAVPIFIFTATILIQEFSFNFGIFSSINNMNLTFTFGAAIGLAAVAMVGFEYISSGGEAFRTERIGEIAKMVGCIVLYTIVSSALLQGESASTHATLALQPFYWIGFAAGIRVMLPPQARYTFAQNWSQIQLFLIPIIVVEVIGMSVYYFEFFALSGADPALVNLITGAHIIPVFLLSLGLSRLRTRMKNSNIEQQWIFGLSFTRDRLPTDDLTLIKFLWFLAVVATLLFAVSQA